MGIKQKNKKNKNKKKELNFNDYLLKTTLKIHNNSFKKLYA